MQAFFFYLFGATWTSYILHASLFNALLTLSTYFVLRNFKLNTTYSFIYSFLFSVIAYPISGSPFVDLHATYLSILGIYSLILAFKTQKKIYWILVPPLLGFSFLAKQVPASYIRLLQQLYCGQSGQVRTDRLSKTDFRHHEGHQTG